MNKKKYLKICKFFNNILEKNENNINILSLDILNIQKNHKTYLEKIKINKFSNFNSLNIIIAAFTTFFYILLRIFNIIYSLTNKNYNYYKKRQILIISHYFFKKNQRFKDMYFSNIFKKLNLNHQTFYINHSRKKNMNKNLQFLENKVIFKDNLDIFFLQLKSLIYFINIYLNETDLKKKYLIIIVIKNIFQGRETENLKYIFNLKKILITSKPKYFITTFEGSSHEKIFFKLSKEINKECVNIGYQHNFLIKSQNSIFNNKIKSTFPDIIFTSSLNNQNVLKKRSFYKDVKILNIGKINQSNLNKIRLRKQKICLLCPEGLYEETIKMINFFENFKIKNNFEFILRLHPDLEKRKEKIFKKIKNFENIKITISKNKLEKDLENAKFGIYTGSSIVFNMFQHGVYPIFLQNTFSDISLDPLQFFKNKKIIKVSNQNQLANILNSKFNKNDIIYNFKNSKNFFSKFNNNKFRKTFKI